MRSFVSHDRPRSGGRLLQMLPMLGLTLGLLLPLLTGCPGVLPEPASRYDAGTGTGSGGSTGTGGSGSGGSMVVGCDAPTMILKKDVTAKGCMGAVCHNVFPPNFMTATKASLAATMAIGTIGCTGMPLVNTANPAASVILKRVQGADCGEQMPSKTFGATEWLNQTEIDCIAAWVMAP